ncbi:alpha/beta hydrolase [uncultured Alsobacter sp.]|uniref:alpha/beta hydrolase n=1 Tax=uncultured Alsobacter sp. TaxID=1748258 RepID=UPI0025E5F851|nr:alpha/beta hydrolase [uncultured Alsobacter sp.]
MALDPFLADLVAIAAKFPAMSALPVERVRKAVPRQLATGLPKVEVASVEDIAIPGPDQPIPLRVYRPDAGHGHPVTVFFHGSGFVICSLDTHDDMCRQICRGSGHVVVSVDYRLAPEHPFPAAPRDCLAAVQWVAANALTFGGDPARLAVCGDSAGGCLATVVARQCRDAGGPRIAAQALIYPVTDHYSASHDSYAERGSGYGMTEGDMRWFWNHYCPDPAQGADPVASPLRAGDLAGLPPTYLVTAEYDVLRDEGRLYAGKLTEDGVPVTTRHYDDVNHGYLHWVGIVPTATRTMDELTLWLREAV